MYGKYDKFNLVLKNIMTDSSNTWGTTDDDRAIYIEIEGLNFVNNYDIDTKTTRTNKVVLTT